MQPKMKWVCNKMPQSEDKNLEVMSLENVKKARAFHKSFPQYSVTPLANLEGMATDLGLGGLFIKDESYRFGLNAFKVLGGSFAMARYIADETGKDVAECDFDYLTSEQLQKDFGQATFFTATDGNHGRGVAWAAHRLGQKAVVHMPKGSTKTRFDNIAKEGRLPSKNSTMMTACALLQKKRKKPNMPLSFRILRGTDMKKFHPGLCRVTAPWPTKPQSSSVNLK